MSKPVRAPRFNLQHIQLETLASGGALPPGLVLNSSGVISGIPTTTGTTPVTMQVTDTATIPTTVKQTLTITID